MPLSFRECTNLEPFSVGTVKNAEDLKAYLRSGTGNLVFAGETGRRKTFSACICANDIKKMHRLLSYEVGFCNVSDFSINYKFNLNCEPWKNTDIYNRLIEFRVLILDDLGVVDPTNSFLELIYSIVNNRIENKNLATIYTTNLSSAELNQQFTPRIVSRITNNVNIKLEGPDSRKKLEF